MSEADYMDDWHHADRYDEEKRPDATHEVVRGNRVVFAGSRAACWAEKRARGGFVQAINE